MTKKMQLDLPDEVYDALARLAQGNGQSPEQMVTEWILSAANTIAGVSIRSSRSTRRRSTAARSTPASTAPAPAQKENDAANTSSRPKQALAGGAGGAGAIYELKITLLESNPAIWRRVQVPGNITLIKLHHALQVLMGWQDYHLHQFAVNGALYGMHVDDWQDATPELLDERGVRLYRIAPVAGTRLVYEYDFGDGWQLEIIIEDISFSQEATGEGAGHVVCLDGQCAGPPEDVGGIGGYEEFVKAIRNRRHPEHRSWLEWVGGSFDPEKFDPEAVNRALKRIR
jgi:hypothetical protein